MPAAYDLGQVAGDATFDVPFVTFDSEGALAYWSGLAEVVRPDGSRTEAGVASDLNNPEDGRHKFVVDLPYLASHSDPSELPAGRYRLEISGDQLGEEVIQRVPVATFTIV